MNMSNSRLPVLFKNSDRPLARTRSGGNWASHRAWCVVASGDALALKTVRHW